MPRKILFRRIHASNCLSCIAYSLLYNHIVVNNFVVNGYVVNCISDMVTFGQVGLAFSQPSGRVVLNIWA